MMEILTTCPVCNGGTFESFIECTDYTVSRETFKIVSCKSCGFKFTNPRPDRHSIVKYYESDDYISHSNTNKGFINKIYHFVKSRAIKNKINLVESFGTSKNILDIGCGTGAFLGAIKKSGWNAIGIEPSEKARLVAEKENSVKAFGEEKIHELLANSTSIITMWHVLEHVHDLQERVRDLNRLLEPNGYAIIAVPNYTSWDASIYKEHWAAYDVPRHLYHFSPDRMKGLFDQHGFTYVKSLPMKMDSFYVSMLSEKYRGNSLGIFKAFVNGLISNIKAKNDAEKYSSVIYVFKKK